MFAEKSAEIFAANGIKVYLFDDLRPTPELSFVIRELGCQSGIILTASHNPKEYNGYKAYWEDGSQIVEPHDVNIIDEVQKVKAEDIRFEGNKELMEIIGDEVDQKFLEKVKTVSLAPEIVKKHKDLKIVYTPIHGTGVKLIPAALRAFGFENIFNVPEQDVVSGNFPTVVSPNPEEPAAMDRITSYNVCYTKLLRGRAMVAPLSNNSTTVPSWIESTEKIVSNTSHGFSSSCLWPKLKRRFSLSMSSTTTSISAPIDVNSDGCLIFLVQLRSEMWIKPSTPSSISTNTPKLVKLRTVAVCFEPTPKRDSISCQGS